MTQSSIVPIRMQNFSKDLMDLKLINDICFIIGSNSYNATSAIVKVATQVLSVVMNPVYGDTYSFPWKRGPHDNMNEYFEALVTFDLVRSQAQQSLSDHDYLQRLVLIFNSEDES